VNQPLQETPREPGGVEARLPEPTPTLKSGALLARALVLLAMAVGGALAYRFTPLKDWLQPAGAVAAWIRETGFAGLAAFVVGMAALILVGVPRLLFCPVAGALFGFWVGLGLCMLGTTASYYTAFLFIRGRRSRSGAPAALPPKLAFLAGNPGLAGVIVARVVPLPGMLITLGLSLSAVRHRVYLAGSIVGQIPEAAPLVLLGAGLLHPGATRYTHLTVLTLVCIFGAWLAIRAAAKRFAQGKRPS
jgi:uncharacterized membrane protein YdjX (TVP38/TMEM64 family)